MCDHTISTQCMVLVIDVLHHFSVPNGKISLMDIGFISLIESVSKQCDHRQTDRLFFLRLFSDSLDLPPVLSCDNRHSQHADLL